jgi:tetratricopeptide (TPR) repeat protein
VAALLNNLGGLLADIGRLEEALGCFDRALAIDEPALGGTHSTVRGIRENRAQVLRRLRAAV